MSATTATTAYEVRQAIAAALRLSIPGMQAAPYVLSNITPPAASVMRGPIVYDQAMDGGVHTWTFLVRAYVSSVVDVGSQRLLDEYLSAEGDLSIKAAIEEDTTLGGIVAALHVTGASGEQEFVRDGGGPLLGSEWTVAVWI